MGYQIIQPPFTLIFREMTKKELAEYRVWFLDSFEDRIAGLEDVVRETPGYGSWVADCTPESLEALGNWFADTVTTRRRTPEEMAPIRLKDEFFITPELFDLTNYSYSVAMDIGMYFGRTFKRKHPHVFWKQFLGSKNYVDYGQPVLTGFGLAPLNPVGIAVVLARGLAKKNRTGNRLHEVFNYWSDSVKPQKH